MPFKGYDRQQNKLVIAFDYDSKFKLMAEHPEIICPICSQKMFLRQGNKYRLHFAHAQKTHNCLSKGETWQHLEGKKIVYDILKKQINYLSDEIKKLYSVTIEQRINEVNRIIDVALLCHNKVVEAHEIQISSITIQELEARTQDYSSQGIATYWYFEEKGSLTTEIQNWLIKNYGEIRFFRIETEVSEI